MNFNIVCVGTVKDKHYIAACDEYLKRLQTFGKVKVIEVKAASIDVESPPNIDKALRLEAELYKKHLKGLLVVADIEGKKLNSEQFAFFISDKKINGISEITFLVGGSYGLLQETKEKADLKLSFSDMTFPHTLFRVMLLEQLYRACMIETGKSYHK